MINDEEYWLIGLEMKREPFIINLQFQMNLMFQILLIAPSQMLIMNEIDGWLAGSCNHT